VEKDLQGRALLSLRNPGLSGYPSFFGNFMDNPNPMKPKNLLLFIGFILIFGCNENQTIQTDEGPIIIKIEGAEFEKISTITVLSNSEFIFLETKAECNLGDGSHLLNCTDEFFVHDPWSQNKIFRFDRSGKFLNTIGKEGKGPGEYSYANDALVSGDTIEILSGMTGEVLRYTRNGSFLESTRFKSLSPSSFYKFPGSNNYLINNSYGDYKAYKFDRNGRILDSLLPNIEANRIALSIDAIVGNTDGSILFNENMYNVIWRWDGNDFEEAYKLDFGPYNYVEGEEPLETFVTEMPNRTVWFIRWFIENKDFLYVVSVKQLPGKQSIDEVEIKHLIYNKTSGKTYELGSGDIRYIFQFPSAISAENKLYLTANPADMADWEPWLEVVKARNLAFDIEGNPIVVIIDLDELLK
jgi:hypothetical protein